MKLSSLYNQVVRQGSRRDPRTNRGKIKSYADTTILYGRRDTEVKTMMVGIDIEVGEMLLADRIRQESGLDLVVSHHPEGRAWAEFYEVMLLQVDMLVKAGVSRAVAQALVDERKREVARRVMPNNHMRCVDAARILDMPFMCVHTPADNHASWFIEGLMAKTKPRKLEDVIGVLNTVPEYQEAIKESSGPRIILGNPKRETGKIFVEMTGGTEGSKEVFGKLYKTGIRTLVSMHMSEDHLRKVKDHNLNVVIAGHISSDNLGLNLLLDQIEKEAKEKFQVIDCSGFRRISRN